MSAGGSDHSVLNQVAEGWNSLAQSVTTWNPRTGKWGGAGDYSKSAFGSVFKSLGSQGGDVNKIASGVVNAIGYNPANGKWGDKGSDADWLNEGFGQINGSNAARHAAGVAGDAVLLAKQQADVLLAQTNERNRVSDIQASNQAQGIRNTARAAGAFNPSMTTPMALGPGAGRPTGAKLGSDQQDFLGL